MFEVGSKVRVKSLSPPGHVRTPTYLRGKTGIIERAIRPFKNPEQLAYGLPAAERLLYRVRFDLRDLWDNADANSDTIDAEIYEHWLEESS